VASVAASGTHDTEALAVWWSQADEAEKREVNALPTIQRLTGGAGLDDRGEGLLEAIFAAASQLVLAPVTDVFGWRDRINEPGTVTDDNWTFRLPWPVDQLNDVPEARARQAQLRAWSERHHRV
jgi:4-alpha-glucanotransferase